MKNPEIEVFEALDFLYMHSDMPVYEPIFKESLLIGYTESNMINICNKGSFICAEKHPNLDYAVLVFGRHPIYSFLLKPVGKLIVRW